jgi:MFS family permease
MKASTKNFILDKEHSVAPSGYNRWLTAIAALAIHLSIGQVYAFSVFKIPLTKLIGITNSAAQDWEQAALGWIFSSAIAFLGISAALFGKWVEAEGPRKAMFVAAICFCSGFFVSALGVYWHQIVLLYLGYGVLGGIGLGIGYISPVSTLIKWFPDRPGMATGMAIMGFGGGAIIAAPLSVALMKHFKSSTSIGVWQTFVVMGILYFCVMMVGVMLIRTPPQNWQPIGYIPDVKAQPMVTDAQVTVNNAVKTPQFWLLWIILCANVTAGIGVLGQASPMIQEMFKVSEAAGAGFLILLSLFNMGGRFVWSSLSDRLGRKKTYLIFFGLGLVLYALIPTAGKIGNILLFNIICCLILSMYGGGFATIPAYIRDLFGTLQVGAIHGRLLTAWSVAGVVGTALIDYIRKSQIDSGVPKAEAYSITMYIMVGVLVIGLIANLRLRPVDPKYHQ